MKLKSITYVERAQACAYYVDGFGTNLENVSKGWMESTEQSMWFYLLLAAESGEI